MKLQKLAFIALFTAFTGVYAQQVKKVDKMPVFVGCEQFKTNDEVKKCFNATFNQAIANEIEFFSNIADYLHIGDTSSKLRFKIDKDGNFGDINVDGANPIFNSFVWSSIVLIQNKLNQLDAKIQPGLDQKAIPMDVFMTIPVRYDSEYDETIYSSFPAYERVLFTIDFEDEIIEIRLNKDNVIRTIGINKNDRNFYLGKYNNLFELATVEPYATKINESFTSGNTLITKGKLDGKEYIIQMKNFFSNKPDDKVLIEVIREENDTWAEYYSYKTKEEFNQSKFATLTYR
ncbi:hypothetical protein [Faecalibacter bovis]|uniref:Uncharacterized protein n=1 Tax=Faecalibacter bovis TaxID=2898187 RepID=A0ABX7XGC0_9FLAO|nr:hypothetical protein [Faecalibacter bovis]QTV06907.1 hypothetical protein J9309_06265 [Faecalibacter bovis]